MRRSSTINCPFGNSIFRKLFNRLHIPNNQECMVWNGPKNPAGYGLITGDGYSFRTHRVSYEYFVGPIPDNLVLDHLCRNRSCCNPNHLEPVTIAENFARGIRKNGNKEKTTCIRGHEFTPKNTRICSRGSRHCRKCHSDYYNERKKIKRKQEY